MLFAISDVRRKFPRWGEKDHAPSYSHFVLWEAFFWTK